MDTSHKDNNVIENLKKDYMAFQVKFYSVKTN